MPGDQSITPSMEPSALMEAQRRFFRSGKTLPLDFRVRQIRRLRKLLVDEEEVLLSAVYRDLGKSRTEAFMTELGFIIAEIDHTLKHLSRWVKPERVGTPLIHVISASYIYREPYGVVFIAGPWNYPIQLTLLPLLGAMAAGNCVVLKPSDVAAHTGSLLAVLLNQTFETAYIHTDCCGVEGTEKWLKQAFDHIFFTGSPAVGRIFYEAAARHLTPVTLELGGKSPCIVDRDIHLGRTSRRIAWGKFINAGQSCAAPEYLLVHADVKDVLLESIIQQVTLMYGEDPLYNPDYGRIVSPYHFDRLAKLIDRKKVVFGGQTDRNQLYMAPTILDGVTLEDAVMQEEIFGPVLPVIAYRDIEEVIDIVQHRLPHPLALYLFTRNRRLQEDLLNRLSFGGGTVNDTMLHLTNPHLPFGGIGKSGMGAYHGKHGFLTFTHQKSILKRSNLLDIPFRYPPYKGKLPILRKLFRLFG